MNWYYYIALVAIVSQLLVVLQAHNNCRYALAKHKRPRPWYRPRTVLIVPCKGRDLAFEKNITSFYNQNYENYLLWFVVAEQSDPAYVTLCELKEQLSHSSKASDVQILVAGQVSSSNGQPSCSQKIHNLLHCCERVSADVEILAFADSDICLRSDWLSHIVYPLHQSKIGVASGYRWFVPKKNNLASLALSAVNAKVAQLLGNTRFNQVWGGSMAVRTDLFHQLRIDSIWRKTISDDLSLSYAVKKAGLKVAFVPATLVASYEFTTWPRLFEFGRRQFLITRVSSPVTWWFGLCSCLYSILGLWAAAAVAIYTAILGTEHATLFAAVPIIFFAGQSTRTILRQRMISRILKQDRPKMRAACIADIFFAWLWSLLLLALIISSTFGRTITWRGIRYKLLGPTETIVIDRHS